MKSLPTRLALAALLLLPAPAQARQTALASHWDGISGMKTAATYHECGTVLEAWNARDRHADHHRLTVAGYGPFVGNRRFDLSRRAFRKIFGSTNKGVCLMAYRVIKRGRCKIHRHDGTY